MEYLFIFEFYNYCWFSSKLGTDITHMPIGGSTKYVVIVR